jgi:hypothetical protein
MRIDPGAIGSGDRFERAIGVYIRRLKSRLARLPLSTEAGVVARPRGSGQGGINVRVRWRIVGVLISLTTLFGAGILSGVAQKIGGEVLTIISGGAIP